MKNIISPHEFSKKKHLENISFSWNFPQNRKIYLLRLLTLAQLLSSTYIERVHSISSHIRLSPTTPTDCNL